MMSSCGCGSSAVTPQLPPTNDRCRASLASTTIGELVWLAGLDEGLCDRFQRLSDVLGLRDCAGNRINIETPVVTCSDFRAQLCAALSGLAAGGEATAQTLLVGADCKLYTIPGGGEQVETPNTAIDSPSVNITLSGVLNRTIRADVNVSDDTGNQLELRADGLFVPESGSAVPTACQQLQAFTVGQDVQSGTILIGADCQKHTFVSPDPLTVLDTSSVNLTLIGGDVLQADLVLSPSSIGAVTPFGLEITCGNVLDCAPPVTVNDTQSVDLLLIGQLLQASVNISNEADNNLELKPDGLYLSVCEALEYGGPSTPAIPGVTRLVGEDCLKYTVPPSTPPTPIDTTTVNITVVGTTIQADVNVQPNTLLTTGPQGLQVTCESVQDCIGNTTNNFFTYDDVSNGFTFSSSADAGNQITTGTDGKPFVAAPALSVVDTPCINLTLAAGVLSAAPVISPQAGNGLTCQGDGLYAINNDIDLVGASTECIQVVVSEAPGPNQFQVAAVPIISSDPGNSLECRATGLFAPTQSLLAADTSCIDLSVVEVPAGTFTISAQPILDPDPCNSLVCNPAGLFVPEQGSSSVGSVLGDPLIDPPAPAVGTVISDVECVNVSNSSQCRSANLIVSYLMPHLDARGDGNPYEVSLVLEYMISIPTVSVIPFTLLNESILSGAGTNDRHRVPASSVQGVLTLPPGANGIICVRSTLTVVSGTPIVGVGATGLQFMQVSQ